MFPKEYFSVRVNPCEWCDYKEQIIDLSDRIFSPYDLNLEENILEQLFTNPEAIGGIVVKGSKPVGFYLAGPLEIYKLQKSYPLY